MSELMKEYIARYRKQYNTIKMVQCNVLSCSIHFSSTGFKHLVFKGPHRRTNKIIKSRLKLIPLIAPVLQNATKVVETRVRDEVHYGVQRNIRYEAVESLVSKSNVKVRVVIRTIGEKGTSQFYSVMRY